MAPLRPLLGNADRLLLSPDGELNLIPFEALADEKNNYLIRRYSFTYLTSGRDLLRFQVKSQSRQGPVVMADPDFDSSGVASAAGTRGGENRRSGDFATLKYGKLSGTKAEAEAIEEILPKNLKLLLGSAATETALKEVKAPSILHIATHGFFLPAQELQVIGEFTGDPFRKLERQMVSVENPLLRSGLALAGFNVRRSGSEDGVLTALEVAGMNLWGTKLVVLSACETGIGEARNGDGVYGLRRALVIAGSQSQIMSLWKVGDDATKELMVEYYKRLKRGEGRHAALRNVQLAMLGSENRQHPYYWASFIPSGEDTPLSW
jgi:CHAT domain-containing protein